MHVLDPVTLPRFARAIVLGTPRGMFGADTHKLMCTVLWKSPFKGQDGEVRTVGGAAPKMGEVKC